MAGTKARLYSAPVVHTHYAVVDYTNLGSTVNLGDVPPCLITDVYVAKTADFNSGSTATIDIGIDYSDGTTDDPDALVDGADLSSSTALGPLEVTQVDSAAWKIGVNATLTATLAATGTAASAGTAYIAINYVPDAILEDLR